MSRDKPRRMTGRVLLALVLGLLAAGCAACSGSPRDQGSRGVGGTASDKDQQRGFYGGISVGGAIP